MSCGQVLGSGVTDEELEEVLREGGRERREGEEMGGREGDGGEVGGGRGEGRGREKIGRERQSEGDSAYNIVYVIECNCVIIIHD